MLISLTARAQESSFGRKNPTYAYVALPERLNKEDVLHHVTLVNDYFIRNYSDVGALRLDPE